MLTIDDKTARRVLDEVCACESREQATACLARWVELWGMTRADLGVICRMGAIKVHKLSRGKRMRALVDAHAKHIDWCNSQGETVATWRHHLAACERHAMESIKP